MKKLLIITNVAWMAVFVMAFQSKTPPAQIDCTKFCYNYDGQRFSGLSLTEANTLAQLYTNNHYRQYSPTQISGMRRRLVDSKSVWFSLEKIKKLVYQIEKYTCNNCDSLKEELGIRFYFGEYPSNVGPSSTLPNFRDLPRNYAHLHTLMFVPTFRQNGKNIDFDPIGLYNQGRCPIALADYLKSYRNNAQLMSIATAIISADQTSSTQNHGGLCPPVCQDEVTAFPTQ